MSVIKSPVADKEHLGHLGRFCLFPDQFCSAEWKIIHIFSKKIHILPITLQQLLRITDIPIKEMKY